MKIKLILAFVLLAARLIGQTNPIELYFPSNLDTLSSDVAPGTFTFYVDPMIGSNVRYTTIFTLVKRESNQSNLDALSFNSPIVKINLVNPNSFQLPIDAEELISFNTYVWQIQTFEEANLVFQSSPFEFTVFDPVESVNFFELSNRSNGKLLICQNGVANFSLKSNKINEEYSVTLKKDGQVFSNVEILDIMTQSLSNAELFTSRLGMNYYSLDLNPIGGAKGLYTLILHKGNQVAFEVKIKN